MEFDAILAGFAAAFIQDQRLLTLQLGDGQRWGETLLPLAVHGDEAVSDSYRYRVECLSHDAGLELKSLLGVPVRLGIAGADGTEQVRCGVVSAAEAAGSDGGFAKYALTIEPPFALLRLRRTSRVFQDLSVPDIVRQVFAEHAAANPVFAAVQSLDFALAGELPLRSYTLQYRESDFDFIVRLLHEEGLAWRFEHGEGVTERGSAASRGNAPQVTLVAFDDPYSLPPAGVDRVRFHRSDATEDEDGLTRWDGTRQIVSGSVALATFDYQPVATGHSGDQSAVDQGTDGARLQSSLEDYDVPGQYYASDADQLAHYARRRQQAHDARAKRFDGGGSVRGLTAGQWFRLDDHPAHEWDSTEQREFVVTRQTFTAHNNLPTELARALPASLRPSLAAAGDAPANDTPYHTTFSAQRRGIPLTPAYAGTALAKPTARGVQTATVVGPGGREAGSNQPEEVHTDAHGRIKVQFHWVRTDEHPTIGANLDDTSSCWVRVAMPSAGAGWGHQFLPRIGKEVLVDFIEGDIDRPVITGVLYNGSHPPPSFSGAGSLPANKTLSGLKSKEHQGGQYNELLFDDTPGEVRAKLSSEHGKTQLNQGYLTHPRTDGKATPRGDGFELRTDRHGAIRAGHGLLLSTEAQNGAAGKQLARDGAQSQLDAALALSQSLGETATAQLADTVETGPDEIKPDNGKGAKKTDGHLLHHVAALKAWEAGTNADKESKSAPKGEGLAQAGPQPLMILSAPAGLVAATDNSLTLAAGTNLDQIAQRDTQQTSGRRWLHNVGQHISLFVAGVKDKIAFKLIAAKGKVQIQAQSDAMELTADKDVAITSCKGKVVISAKQDILLTSGGGYIKLSGGNIDIHCPSVVSIKGADHALSGPASIGVNMQGFPSADLYDEKFQVLGPNGKPLKGLLLAVNDGKQQLLHRIKLDGSNQRIHTTQPTQLEAELVWSEILPLSGEQ